MIRRLLALAATAFALTMTTDAADKALQAGDTAPAFEASDQDGNAVTSADLYKQGTTLVFFYPKAGTGG